MRLSNVVPMPNGTDASIRITEDGNQTPRFDFMVSWDSKNQHYRMKGNAYQLKDAQEMAHLVLRVWAQVVCKSAARKKKPKF